ncbi:MAG TPA: hypothetical protein VKV02_10995 [Acidobacteriaceae bacterium]|nr:hypothetical protein [Acidobacteriaceae bacterium]
MQLTPESQPHPQAGFRSRRAAVSLQALVSLVFCGSLSGCVVVGASSRGGFFIWPGGIGLLLILALLFFVLRRR